MIKIYSNGDKITYTAGDTFVMNVTTADSFDEGSTLTFKIAQNETSEDIISKEFSLNGTGFEVSLSEEDRDLLPIGEYIYKLVLKSANDEIITRKSGEFIVKWGA